MDTYLTPLPPNDTIQVISMVSNLPGRQLALAHLFFMPTCKSHHLNKNVAETLIAIQILGWTWVIAVAS